jgi:hypothetical protein
MVANVMAANVKSCKIVFASMDHRPVGIEWRGTLSTGWRRIKLFLLFDIIDLIHAVGGSTYFFGVLFAAAVG